MASTGPAAFWLPQLTFAPSLAHLPQLRIFLTLRFGISEGHVFPLPGAGAAARTEL